jgi:hypothetical protein
LLPFEPVIFLKTCLPKNKKAVGGHPFQGLANRLVSPS